MYMHWYVAMTTLSVLLFIATVMGSSASKRVSDIICSHWQPHETDRSDPVLQRFDHLWVGVLVGMCSCGCVLLWVYALVGMFL